MARDGRTGSREYFMRCVLLVTGAGDGLVRLLSVSWPGGVAGAPWRTTQMNPKMTSMRRAVLRCVAGDAAVQLYASVRRSRIVGAPWHTVLAESESAVYKGYSWAIILGRVALALSSVRER